MKMKRFGTAISICRSVTLSALIVLTSLACSPKHIWYHPLKDQGEYRTDRYKCQTEAAQYIIALDEVGDDDLHRKRVAECLQVLGYDHALAEEVPPGVTRFD